MRVFPAIDLRGGNVVRLSEGDFGRMNIYGENPAETAKRFFSAGARYLHTVDLDGAKDGAPANTAAIREICEATDMFVQTGGGIRDEMRIERLLEAGVSRVILGTAAIRDFDFTKRMTEKYGEKIAVGVDAKDGSVRVSGWLEDSGIDAFQFCRRLRDAGVKTVIYTDISRDGMLGGCNLAAYERLAEIQGLDIIASGGVTFESEIIALREMGTYGVILGKALYEGKLELSRAIELT